MKSTAKVVIRFTGQLGDKCDPQKRYFKHGSAALVSAADADKFTIKSGDEFVDAMVASGEWKAGQYRVAFVA